LRTEGRAAIVVDLGSAITVDLLSPEGEFLGGAIMPGIGTAARALYERTDLLPLSPLVELEQPPAPLGRSTDEALRSGLYWGAVGGIRELIERLSQAQGPVEVFLTGGAAPAVAELLASEGRQVRFVPHLTLAGIALVGFAKQRAEP
jgi:type III pantothenate kinase